jgi:RHS repeat-associated protein
LGKQIFELSNHLGNILATITDKKLQVSLNTTSTAYFEADVQTVQDYYAFGMQMPGRKLSGGYRFGFNGKENDNEVKGEGNEINFGGRVYDSRLGKFLSIDPMARSYPGESNYIFAGNSPLQFTDYNGYFKISPFFAQRYPTLARIIESYLPLLKDNRLAKEGWIKTVGFSNHAEGEKAFDDMVTYGQGLWITPTRPGNEQREGIRQDLSGFFEPTGNAGEWQGPKGYPENVTIGYSFLDDLETAMKKGNANDIGKQMFVVSVLIMHEASHWGKWKYNCCEVDGDYRYEAGANFEYNTFGTRFSYQNADKKYFDDDKLKGFYNQEKGGYNSSSFGFSINQSSTYWNRIKNSALSGGQKGDPSLKENGDKEPNPKVFLPKDTYRTGNGETSGQNSYNY